MSLAVKLTCVPGSMEDPLSFLSVDAAKLFRQILLRLNPKYLRLPMVKVLVVAVLGCQNICR